MDIKYDGALQRNLIICLTLSTRLVSLSIHMLNIILKHFVKHRDMLPESVTVIRLLQQCIYEPYSIISLISMIIIKGTFFQRI